MRPLMLFLVVTVFVLTTSTTAFAQKYHSANDADVEFSLEEKNQGPQPFYIDKEAIEKARKAQYASEKKEAIWYAKRLSKFLTQYREQKIAIQNRAVAERAYLAQQSMDNISHNAKALISAHDEQARAIITRAHAARMAPAQGTEASRALASLDHPVFKVFKHQPKRAHALRLWSKMGRKMVQQSQAATIKKHVATRRIVNTPPSSLPLALQPVRPLKMDRRPASIITPKTSQEGVWQGVARKLSGAFNRLKSKLFNW